MGSVYVLHLLFLNIIIYFMNDWVTTYIYYYFYSTAYISLKRNEIEKGKEQNTWCNRNQSFLQCSCVENGERRNYPQCNMISPTMHTRLHSVHVCVDCVNLGGGYSATLDLVGLGGYSATLDLDLGKKVGNLDFGGGGGGILKLKSHKVSRSA